MSETLQLDRILFDEVVEGHVELSPSEGEVPGEIAGTYLLNGPANFRRGDFTYRHWLDGDGLIRALRLENGKAEHRMRFVRTKKFTDEKENGKPLYRAFGTGFEGDKLRRRMALETPANVSVWVFGERLLAFGEQALPWELSPDTLETVGECNFNGKLLEISPFSAHPKIVNNRLCNFGLKYLMAVTRLCYWEFDEDFNCCSEWEIDPGQPYSVHDFTVSENFAAFYLSPYMLDIGAFVRGGRPIHDALEWNLEEENVLIVHSRDGSGETHRLPIGLRGYCLHLIQSFEDGDHLIIDLLETEEPLYLQYLPLPSLFKTVKPCGFVRITVDTTKWTVVDAFKAQQDVHLDFPALLEGGSKDLVWALGMPVDPVGVSKYYDRILRFDWKSGDVVDSYRAPEGSFLSGEPSMVAKADDSEGGYLICPMWNSQSNTCVYLIFDAFDLSAGPVTSLPLPTPSPLGFHSTFTNLH